MAREKRIEKHMKQIIESMGGYMLKQNASLFTGIPDRLAVLPTSNPKVARYIFIEVKRPGEDPTDIQLEVHDDLRAIGCEVIVLDNVRDLRQALIVPKSRRFS